MQIADVTDVEIKLRLDAESVLEPGDDADQLGPVMPSEELDALGAAKPFGFDRAVKRAGADRVAKGVGRRRARDAGNKAVLDVGRDRESAAAHAVSQYRETHSKKSGIRLARVALAPFRSIDSGVGMRLLRRQKRATEARASIAIAIKKARAAGRLAR